MAKGKWIGIIWTSALVVILQASNGLGIEINDKISIEGVLAGAYQYQNVDAPFDQDNAGRGALPFEPEIRIRLTEKDEIFFKLGFAAGNGLNEISPFNLAPWAAPLEDDVKDINGRNRDYLLTAWYAHTFAFNEEHTLQLTGGIIDATDYLDQNAFSNDEFSQFMNEALVNAPNAFLPSFDIGGAADWDMGNFEIAAVYMNVGENRDGNNFNYYGIEVQYNLNMSLGKGGYRVIISYGSEDFLDPTGQSLESRAIVLFSFDQKFGEIIGAWVRFGFQDDKAAVNYENIYSGGIDISGTLWGRQKDNMGIGYGYLDGCNQDIEKTQVAEAYVRFVLDKYFALTFDVQYMRDELKSGEGPKGFIYGIRLAAHF
ncbi:MAG: porin [Nitrospira bacterium SG8_3]|nr:MAG: porin [Nitrospira bacterium SG8_3]